MFEKRYTTKRGRFRKTRRHPQGRAGQRTWLPHKPVRVERGCCGLQTTLLPSEYTSRNSHSEFESQMWQGSKIMAHCRLIHTSQHGSPTHGIPGIGGSKARQTEGGHKSAASMWGPCDVVHSRLGQSHPSRKSKAKEKRGSPQRLRASKVLRDGSDQPSGKDCEDRLNRERFGRLLTPSSQVGRKEGQPADCCGASGGFPAPGGHNRPERMTQHLRQRLL